MHNETEKKRECGGDSRQIKRVMVLRTTSVFFRVNAVFVLQTEFIMIDNCGHLTRV